MDNLSENPYPESVLLGFHLLAETKIAFPTLRARDCLRKFHSVADCSEGKDVVFLS